MSSFDPAPDSSTPQTPTTVHTDAAGPTRTRVGTVVWGLIVMALAALIIIAQLGIVTLNGTYVLIGLMIGAGAALVIGGLLSARKRDNEPTTGKS
ncbi:MULTISPECIES: hypothetical protein [Micrococcaceae]|uniref:hypothetical protein n=1 Tax=Micrococcaceae TaxID=1268 RepID=UPI000CE4340D|nr:MULTISPECIES: hypothetical protein [Micrococcaceae]QDG67890.1 hypothetical protein NIBR502772_18305 [Pseudarthrobacter sp. NIBRBAC000502772]